MIPPPTVFLSGQAGKILAVESATATVEVVEHRYGEEAGAATADGLRTVGNVAEVGLNAKKMGKKAILGAVVKETGMRLFVGLVGGGVASFLKRV